MKEVTKMTFRLLWMLIAQQFKTERHIMIPFILVMSVLFGIEYILLTLNMNTSIRQHSETIPIFIGIGNVFMSILGVLFILYANRFIMRRRQQMLAMNMILGMEKKHFRWMMFIETVCQYIVIAIISVTGGYLFGTLTYMLLNRILGQTQVSLTNYPFSISALGYTLLILALMMLYLFIINNIKITLQSPIKLIQQQHSIEKQWPKLVLYILLIIGFIAIVGSYMIALKDTLVLISMRNVFIALFLVMIGTYCLFISLGTLVLDWLQKIPSIYYQPKYFFTISGLRSRMKANAIGLASLTMLCTVLIVTLGMSLSTYRGIHQRVNHFLPTQYRIEFNGDINQSDAVEHKVKQLKQDIRKSVKIDSFREYTAGLIPVDYNKESFLYRDNDNLSLNLNSVYIVVMNQKDYNTINQKHLQLKENELGIVTNSLIMKHLKKVHLKDEVFETKQLNGNNFAYPVPGSVTLIVKDVAKQHDIIRYYIDGNYKKIDDKAYFNTFIAFNIKDIHAHQLNSMMDTINKKYDVQIENKEKINKELSDIYGGLIFIGVVVSFVLIIGTFMMMYYKNIAEGYEDRQNYQIMRQLGLEEAQIRSTIHHQMIVIFTLPIVIAIIHVLFATKLIYNLLGILDITKVDLFLTSYISVLMIVMVLYALMYVITSRVYYRLIHR